MIAKTILIRLLVALASFATGNCLAELPERLRSPDDGKLDLSQHLLEHRGMLPVPIIITEPAVGYGGGLAAVYFDQPLGQKLTTSAEQGTRPIAPNISVLGGFKTENGSWGVLAGHSHSWQEDRYRYQGGLAKLEMQLDYYGRMSNPRSYQLDALGTFQQLLVRAGESDWYIGGRYLLASTSTKFSQGWPEELGAVPLKDIGIGRLSLIADHDTRDNIFTPSAGHFIEAELAMARPELGDSSSYEQLNLRGFHWQPLAPKWVLGLRGNLQTSRGDIPFFAQPFIKLRGLPAMRYQDTQAAALETELWWKATTRWSLVGFGGGGRAWGRRDCFQEAPTITAYGAGFRYLIASRLGLHAGLDIAEGPQGKVYYIQVGSAWR
jgi:hypothetical protein